MTSSVLETISFYHRVKPKRAPPCQTIRFTHRSHTRAPSWISSKTQMNNHRVPRTKNKSHSNHWMISKDVCPQYRKTLMRTTKQSLLKTLFKDLIWYFKFSRIKPVNRFTSTIKCCFNQSSLTVLSLLTRPCWCYNRRKEKCKTIICSHPSPRRQQFPRSWNCHQRKTPTRFKSWP